MTNKKSLMTLTAGNGKRKTGQADLQEIEGTKGKAIKRF
jgi:hypothetical protein